MSVGSRVYTTSVLTAEGADDNQSLTAWDIRNWAASLPENARVRVRALAPSCWTASWLGAACIDRSIVR